MTKLDPILGSLRLKSMEVRPKGGHELSALLAVEEQSQRKPRGTFSRLVVTQLVEVLPFPFLLNEALKDKVGQRIDKSCKLQGSNTLITSAEATSDRGDAKATSNRGTQKLGIPKVRFKQKKLPMHPVLQSQPEDLMAPYTVEEGSVLGKEAPSRVWLLCDSSSLSFAVRSRGFRLIARVRRVPELQELFGEVDLKNDMAPWQQACCCTNANVCHARGNLQTLRNVRRHFGLGFVSSPAEFDQIVWDHPQPESAVEKSRSSKIQA